MYRLIYREEGIECMKKLIFISLLSLLLLTACEQEKDSVIEAFKSEGIKITKMDPINSMVLNGIKPNSFYIIDNGKQMVVYVFDSKEKQELGFKDFKKQREVLSSYDPPIYQANKNLVIVYGSVTPEVRIQKAVNRIK
jgi:hypothetical protein